MKRLLILSMCHLIIFTAPFALAQEPADSTALDFDAGKAAGRAEARGYYNHLMWGVGGFAGGLFLLGPIGGATVVGLSQAGTPTPSFETQLRVADSTRAYYDGFMSGYAQRIEHRDFNASLVGGIIGTTALAAVVAVVLSQMSSTSFAGL